MFFILFYFLQKTVFASERNSKLKSERAKTQNHTAEKAFRKSAKILFLKSSIKNKFMGRFLWILRL